MKPSRKEKIKKLKQLVESDKTIGDADADAA